MSDQDTTAQLPPAEPPPERESEGGPRRLLRSRKDRVIAGVAGGLGRYFGIDPVIVRIAFAISIFFGGLGVVAYAALALFVPTAPDEGEAVGPPPAERSRALAIGAGIALVVIALSWGLFDGPWWGGGFFLSPLLFVALLVGGAVLIARRAGGARVGGAVGTFLIGLAAFIGLCAVAFGAAWAGATGHGVVVALIVIAIGAMLALAAFNGGARWLIAPALALAVPLGVVSATDISFGDGIGKRTYRPLSVASMPEGYELGIGHLEVDLRGLDWEPDTVVDLEIDLGIGAGVVAVPSDVCVTTDLDARAGNLRVAGDDSDGVDVHSGLNDGSTATPRLDLTGEVDLGQLRVINDDHAELEGRGRFHLDDGENRGEMATALHAACEPEPAPSGGGGDGANGDQGRAGRREAKQR